MIVGLLVGVDDFSSANIAEQNADARTTVNTQILFIYLLLSSEIAAFLDQFCLGAAPNRFLLLFRKETGDQILLLLAATSFTPLLSKPSLKLIALNAVPTL
jgi:hypothetical protein